MPALQAVVDPIPFFNLDRIAYKKKYIYELYDLGEAREKKKKRKGP